MLLTTGADPNGAPQQNQVLPISASASSDFGASHHDSAGCWIIASEEILPDNFHHSFAMPDRQDAPPGSISPPMLDLPLRYSPCSVQAPES
jgi:hypothetical protein